MLNEGSGYASCVLYAVVPIKAFRSAKTRLGGKLDQERRADLAATSADRVLRAIETCDAIQHRVAVVEDEEAAHLAARHHFEILLRPDLWGQNAAVEAGFDLARERGATALVTVAADVPLLRSQDLLQLLSRGEGLVLAPDREGRGTNALFIKPALPLRLHFGPDSLAMFKREAAEMRIPVEVLANDRLRIDIDTPDDLDVLEKIGPEGRQVLVDAGRRHIDAAREKQFDPSPA
jgi:2-phospho-L-lactate guanylyltransferase